MRSGDGVIAGTPDVFPRLTPGRLAAVIGPELAERLMRALAGRRIPRIDADRFERDRRIREAIDAGEPARAIAEREGLHHSCVVRIGKRML